MTLSPALASALRSFNGLPPTIRCGLLPPKNGQAFLGRILASSAVESRSTPAHPPDRLPPPLVAAAEGAAPKAAIDPYLFAPPQPGIS